MEFIYKKLVEKNTGNYNWVATEKAESGFVRKFYGKVHTPEYDENKSLKVFKEEVKNICEQKADFND